MVLRGRIPNTAPPNAYSISGGPQKDPGTYGYNTEKTVGVQAVENIYRGGRTEAQTSQATNVVKAGQAQLKATEQAVLLQAATSYLDVVRDQATVDLDANNEAVLKRQLDAEQDRLRVGEVTRTDVALAEASYQQARAQYTTAVGTLQTDRAAFQRVVGQAPGKLVQPVFKYELPGTLEQAVDEAETANPTVIAAEFTERAARDGDRPRRRARGCRRSSWSAPSSASIRRRTVPSRQQSAAARP